MVVAGKDHPTLLRSKPMSMENTKKEKNCFDFFFIDVYRIVTQAYLIEISTQYLILILKPTPYILSYLPERKRLEESCYM